MWSVRSLSRNMLAKLSQKWDENEMMNTGQTQKRKAVAYLPIRVAFDDQKEASVLRGHHTC